MSCLLRPAGSTATWHFFTSWPWPCFWYSLLCIQISTYPKSPYRYKYTSNSKWPRWSYCFLLKITAGSLSVWNPGMVRVLFSKKSVHWWRFLRHSKTCWYSWLIRVVGLWLRFWRFFSIRLNLQNKDGFALWSPFLYVSARRK